MLGTQTRDWALQNSKVRSNSSRFGEVKLATTVGRARAWCSEVVRERWRCGVRKRAQARHALFRLPPPLRPILAPNSACVPPYPSPRPPDSAQPLGFAFAPSIAPTLVSTRRGPSIAPPVYASPLPSFPTSTGYCVYVTLSLCAIMPPSCARPSFLTVYAESPFSSVRDRFILSRLPFCTCSWCASAVRSPFRARSLHAFLLCPSSIL